MTKTKTRKIAVLIDLLIPGGVQKTAIQEVLYLRKYGYDARLIVLMRTNFQKKYNYLVTDVPYEFLSDRYPKFFQRSYKIPYFKFLSTLHLLSPIISLFKIKKGEYDLVISHGTTTSFTSLSLLYFKQMPYITIIHDPMAYIFEKVYRKTPLRYLSPVVKFAVPFLEKRIVKNAATCFVASTVHAKFLKSHYHINPQILYLGVKSPTTIVKNHGNKVLSLGRWEKEKNIAVILELAQKIPQTQFIVAGNWTQPSDLSWFQSEIKKRNLSDRIDLITNYKEEELPGICQRACVWVHPNFEAFSLSAIEAASHGLAIVIPKKSGVTELFKNGVCGFFPEVEDKNALFEAVNYLVKNPRKASLMGARAAKIARRYTWERHSKLISLSLNKFYSQQ